MFTFFLEELKQNAEFFNHGYKTFIYLFDKEEERNYGRTQSSREKCLGDYEAHAMSKEAHIQVCVVFGSFPYGCLLDGLEKHRFLQKYEDKRLSARGKSLYGPKGAHAMKIPIEACDIFRMRI